MSLKLFDFECPKCGNVFEELVADGEKMPCTDCRYPCERNAFCNSPTNPHNVHWTEVFQKSKNIKNKLQGKVPWRKSSHSQSE